MHQLFETIATQCSALQLNLSENAVLSTKKQSKTKPVFVLSKIINTWEIHSCFLHFVRFICYLFYFCVIKLEF